MVKHESYKTIIPRTEKSCKHVFALSKNGLLLLLTLLTKK